MLLAAKAALQPIKIISGDSGNVFDRKETMNWIPLTTEEELNAISEKSSGKPQVILKHSTSCSTSKMVLSRLERADAPGGIDFYYLDLLRYRSVSNAVAEKFNVHHESPQVLVIKNGNCVFDESHHAIMMDEIAEQAAV